MPSVRVLYFAKAREVAGLAEEEVQLQEPNTHSDALTQEIVRRHPGLSSVLTTCVLAVNQEYVQVGERVGLKQGDEVAVIPPLSGG